MDEVQDDMTLEERLRRAGAILAIGAIRAVLKERQGRPADASIPQEKHFQGQESADSSIPATV